MNKNDLKNRIKSSVLYEIFYKVKTNIFGDKIVMYIVFGAIIVFAAIMAEYISHYDAVIYYVTDTKKDEIKEDQVIPVTVCVEGEVNKPGTYKLNSENRIYDAIEKAGGVTENASLDGINSAKILSDEMYIYVPSKNSSTDIRNNSSVQASNKLTEIININTADLDTLCKLPKIGPKTAQKIIDYRNVCGGFDKIEDIMNVSGIGQKIYNEIKNNITV